MSEVIWLPEALEDLKRLYAFIEPHNPAAASRVVDTDYTKTMCILYGCGML